VTGKSNRMLVTMKDQQLPSIKETVQRVCERIANLNPRPVVSQ
jgi:hypothetical protein